MFSRLLPRNGSETDETKFQRRKRIILPRSQRKTGNSKIHRIRESAHQKVFRRYYLKYGALLTSYLILPGVAKGEKITIYGIDIPWRRSKNHRVRITCARLLWKRFYGFADSRDARTSGFIYASNKTRGRLLEGIRANVCTLLVSLFYSFRITREKNIEASVRKIVWVNIIFF